VSCAIGFDAVTPARCTSTASDTQIGSPKATRLCWRSVRPEPTTSATASATPSWIEISTAPSSRMTSASTP